MNISSCRSNWVHTDWNNFNPLDADGQVFRWLADDFRGIAPPEPSVNNSSVKPVAARGGKRTVLSLIGRPKVGSEAETIRVVDLKWETEKGPGMFNPGGDMRIGPAEISDITSSIRIAKDRTVLVTINPGATGRGKVGKSSASIYSSGPAPQKGRAR